jgi:hypothetical protein
MIDVYKIIGLTTTKTHVTFFTHTGKHITKELNKNIYKILQKVLQDIQTNKYSIIYKNELENKCFIEEYNNTHSVIKLFKKLKEFIVGKSQENTTKEILVAEINGQQIEGVEALKKYFEYDLYNNTQGVIKFLERLSKIIHTRQHSVEDLLNFMQTSNLAIADDGCIIAYKVVNKLPDSDIFVDVHTGKVKQQIGSYVCMDEYLVDPSRHHSCSVGLHVCSQDYLQSFRGNTILLIKVPPENAIAVPHNENSKIRVCGYHIIDTLPNSGKDLLFSGKSIENDLPTKYVIEKHIVSPIPPTKETVFVGLQGKYYVTQETNPVFNSNNFTSLNRKVLVEDAKKTAIVSEQEITNTIINAKQNINNTEKEAVKFYTENYLNVSKKEREYSQEDIANKFGTSVRTLLRWVKRYE